MAASDELLEQFCLDAYPRLVATLTHYCGDVYVGQELAQEALVVACQRWATVADLADPVAWTYRVGVNRANSWFRRRRVERRARARTVIDDVHRDPDGADRVAVRAALADLSPKQREAVILRYFLDLTVEQAASLLGVSNGAVRGLTHRAFKVLHGTLRFDEVGEHTDVG